MGWTPSSWSSTVWSKIEVIPHLLELFGLDAHEIRLFLLAEEQRLADELVQHDVVQNRVHVQKFVLEQVERAADGRLGYADLFGDLPAGMALQGEPGDLRQEGFLPLPGLRQT